MIADKVWRLKQNETHIFYQVYESTGLDKMHTTDTDDKDLPRMDIKTESLISDFGKEKISVSVRNKSNQHKAKQHSSVHSKRSNPPITPYENHQLVKVKVGHEAEVKTEYDDGDGDTSNTEHVSILQDYFQLDVDIESLYQQWCTSDTYFQKTAANFWGVRMLRQDPVENLFSFICSSNNNISRISSMVEKLCDNYGRPIAMVDGKMHHSFPSVSAMTISGVEERLRELGFGYRAKFIAVSAKYIMDNDGEEWVASLRQRPYAEAKAELMKLCGVGAKVADCVCLMSLDKPGALPVDTHVWQFAARHYLPKLQRAKSITDKLYQEIGDYFRNLWGDYAGWAHSVLFTAELRHMQSKKSTSSDPKVKDETQNKKLKREAPSTAMEDGAESDHTKSKRPRNSKAKTALKARSKKK